MKVLLIGKGGRESAIAWAISKSPLLTLLRCAPGNPGIARYAELVDIDSEDIEGLVVHAVQERYDLVVVGPEKPLVAGLADRLREEGVAVFGPDAAAATLEGSKVFAKRFMVRHDIPTADFSSCATIEAARFLLPYDESAYPLVIKADGLADGKGVRFATSRREALEIAINMLQGRLENVGDAGRCIVIEKFLEGREISFFVITDGQEIFELETAQDYQRLLDGDQGPTTGGMGCYSPSVVVDDHLRAEIMEQVVRPTIAGLKAEGRPYRGVLYFGLILTEEGLKVLEFNVRFGDPEAQVLLPRLKTDLLPVLYQCALGKLETTRLEWSHQVAICVSMCSAGYPTQPIVGKVIHGIELAESIPNVLVFHAGTRQLSFDVLSTAGGRALTVVALADDLPNAFKLVYRAVDCIGWQGEYHRRDIAADAFKFV